jgi:hypothetical protein
MSNPKDKYLKYKLRYTRLKNYIENYEQKGAGLSEEKIEEIIKKDKLNNDVVTNNTKEEIIEINNTKSEEIKKSIKNIIKLKDYTNRYIYKNNKDESFIDNLNIEGVNNRYNSSSYYKINNNDLVLNKFVSNDEFFKNNDELRVLNYKNDEILFEVFSKN